MDLMDLKGAIVIASAFGASTLIRLFCKKEDLTVPNILFTLFYFFMIGIAMANMIAKPDSIGFWLIAGAYPLMCSGGMFYVYDAAPKK